MATPEATPEVLIRAYQRACFPNPFHPERGYPQMAALVRARMAEVNFSPYWGDMFRELKLEFFAQIVFRAAESQEGPRLLATVATELAGSFGEAVLEAHFDTPLLEEPQPPYPLAQFLIDRRAELAGSPPYPRPPRISSAWIRYAHTLTLADAAKHDLLLKEISGEFTLACHESEQTMRAEAGLMGGFNIFERDHLIATALARPLARHFSEIVVSQLRKPAIAQ